MATPVGPDMSGIEKTRSHQLGTAAFQRADVGRKAKEGDKELRSAQEDSVRTLTDDEVMDAMVRNVDFSVSEKTEGVARVPGEVTEDKAGAGSEAQKSGCPQCPAPPATPPGTPPPGSYPIPPPPPPPSVFQPVPQPYTHLPHPLTPTPWPLAPYPPITQSPAPPPPPGSTYPSDPYAPVMTAGGVIRQLSQDGTFFVSLPNSVVLNQFPDGSAYAYDAKAQAPIPAETKKVTHPGVGEETQYEFKDAAGSHYTLFSKSLDFITESRDKSVKQMVYPTGDMFILAKTQHTDPATGEPAERLHRVHIGPDGVVNSFGEPGVFVNFGSISFFDGVGRKELPLPYSVPGYQGYEQSLQALNPYSSTGPVSGPPEGFTPPSPPPGLSEAAAPSAALGAPQGPPPLPAGTLPYPDGYQAMHQGTLQNAAASAPVPATPVELPSPGVAGFPGPPPGTTGFPPSEGPATRPDGAGKTGETKPAADHTAGATSEPPKSGAPCATCPKQEHVKKSIWQKIKDFFKPAPMHFPPLMYMNPFPWGMYAFPFGMMNPMLGMGPMMGNPILNMGYAAGLSSVMAQSAASMYSHIAPYGTISPYPMSYFMPMGSSPFYF